MSHWNYRMTVTLIDGEEFWAIRELYYDDAGEVVSWTQDPAYPAGETDEEFYKDMRHYWEATQHPAFDIDKRIWLDAEIKAETQRQKED